MENTEKKSMTADHFTTSFALLLIAIISCVSIYSYLKHNPGHLLVFDDSYITLTFASNLLRYGDITYDGTALLAGATSPLHIIFIALCGLFLEMETASLAVGIIFFILSSLLVYLWTLAIYNKRILALLAGLMMATNGWLVYDSLNGLETTTFICFSLLTFYIYYRYPSKPFYCIPLFLSILTRPEGWFILCALWMWQSIQYLMQRDKRVLKNLLLAIGIFFVLIVPYIIFFLYSTGSPFPNTALAKTIFFAEVVFPLSIKFESLKDGLTFFYTILLFPYPWLIFAFILFARKVITLPYLWFYYIIFHLFYFFFFPGAMSHYWCRYQHIFLPMLIIGIVGGASELIMMFKGKTVRYLLTGFVVLFIGYNQITPFISIKNMYTTSLESTQKPIINLGKWLKDNTPPDALIALHDIGIVGYFSDRRILDLVGLTNPAVKNYYWDRKAMKPFKRSERRIIDYLKIKKPDYLVMFPEWDRFFNLLQPSGRKNFNLIYTTPPLYPSELQYNVYKCNWIP